MTALSITTSPGHHYRAGKSLTFFEQNPINLSPSARKRRYYYWEINIETYPRSPAEVIAYLQINKRITILQLFNTFCLFIILPLDGVP